MGRDRSHWSKIDVSSDNAVGSEDCAGWRREANIDDRKWRLRNFRRAGAHDESYAVDGARMKRLSEPDKGVPSAYTFQNQVSINKLPRKGERARDEEP
jgi:hypothetical protein